MMMEAMFHLVMILTDIWRGSSTTLGLWAGASANLEIN